MFIAILLSFIDIYISYFPDFRLHKRVFFSLSSKVTRPTWSPAFAWSSLFFTSEQLARSRDRNEAIELLGSGHTDCKVHEDPIIWIDPFSLFPRSSNHRPDLLFFRPTGKNTAGKNLPIGFDGQADFAGLNQTSMRAHQLDQEVAGYCRR